MLSLLKALLLLDSYKQLFFNKLQHQIDYKNRIMQKSNEVSTDADNLFL